MRVEFQLHVMAYNLSRVVARSISALLGAPIEGVVKLVGGKLVGAASAAIVRRCEAVGKSILHLSNRGLSAPC